MANSVRKMIDGLQNFVANLGTERDKFAATGYGVTTLAPEQLLTVYRSSWLPRKIVDIPAMDSFREWRLWRATNDQIEAIEAEEKRLGLRSKFIDARIRARLYGGAALYFDTGDNPAEPLDLSRVKRGAIRFVTVLTANVDIKAGEQETDPLQPNYGKPRYYTIGGTQQIVHPSRLVIFIGAPIPDDRLSGAAYGWGDSVLTSVYDAVRQADATSANIASLVFEAKVDVITVNGLMDMMDGSTEEEKLRKRYMLAGMLKGNNGMLVLDSNESYEQKSAQFSTLPDIMDRFFQNVSGAADIPLTRLFGQSPGGLNSTGESDTRNYYDRIAASQELDVRPAIAVADEMLIRSALGSRPEEIYYDWAPLWQLSSREQAEIFKMKADAARVIVGNGGTTPEILPVAVISKAIASAFIEDGSLPGLEGALDEYGYGEETSEEEQAAAMTPRPSETEQLPAARQAANDAAPRPLYIRRDVLNADEIIAWAKSQGFKTTLPAADLHVTIIYSRAPVNWLEMDDPYNSRNEDGTLTIPAGGPRVVERFGDAVVLSFASSELGWRNMSLRERGASWDHEQYVPHITISYAADELDVDSLVPYRGVIRLGPEIFEDINDDFRASIVEDREHARG